MTVTKKFRELHSFSKFLLEEWSDRLEDESKTSSFKDYFEPYLKQLVKEKELARMIPLEHIDRLLTASAENHMVYTILTLMYRAGLSSTEIIERAGRFCTVWRRIVCVFKRKARAVLYTGRCKRNFVFLFGRMGRRKIPFL